MVRESSGSYYMDDSSVDTPYDEAAYRWELLGVDLSPGRARSPRPEPTPVSRHRP